MSGKAEPPGAQASPAPLPNLLLYVPQHPGGPLHAGPGQHHQQIHPGQCITRRGMHQSDQVDSGKNLLPTGGGEKKLIKDDLADRSLQQIHYQTAFQNGIPFQKHPASLSNVISIPDKSQSVPPVYNCKTVNEINVDQINSSNNNNNCIPGLSNNTFSIGIQGGQRILQADILNSFNKSSDKLASNQLIQAGLCGNSFLEMNQEHGQSGGNSTANPSRSESVRSEAGESCSSLSSGDSQNDCPGNILILPGAIHGQQILNQNQIVLSQNRAVLNHGATPGNIVIANNSNAVLSNHIDNNMQTAQMTMPNYQFLEQNVAQQSIVNRSISIVNRQIISNREGNQGAMDNEGHTDHEDTRQNQRRPTYEQGVGSNFVPDGMVRQGVSIGMDGEIVIVNNLPHQFVRTPGGIVLGMMPGAKHSAVGSSASAGVVNGVNNSVGGVPNSVPGDRQAPADAQPPNKAHIVVPYGWNRIIHLNSVIYTSPSGAALGSLDEIRGYLQAAGTCKCGLDCPLRPECIFNFDPKVAGKPSETRPEQSRVCSYKRKMMASSQVSSHLTSVQPQIKVDADQHRKQDGSASKKRKRKANPPYPGPSLFQILAHRDSGAGEGQPVQHHQPNQPQHHQQQYLIQDSLQQHQLLKERMWMNSPQQMPGSPVNAIPHPNQTGSPTVPQVRFNSPHPGNSTNNFGSGSVPMTVQHQPGIMLCQGPPQSVKPEDANSPAHQPEFQAQGRHPNGSQVLSMSGSSIQPHNMPGDREQKVLHHQIMLNNPQVTNITSMSIPQTNINNQLSGISHVIGPNGQIIGIQTSNIPRSQSMGSINSNDGKSVAKCNTPVEIKSDISLNTNSSNDDSKPVIHMQSQNMQLMPNGLIIPSSQSSMPTNQLQINPCNINVINGSNIQQLPPEVIQRINQQQQIFIQQNQKQMELAMKGIKTHVMSPSSQANIGIRTSTYSDVNRGNPAPNQNQNQLIVSGNTVMMTNHQRMPPWQINRMNKLQQANQNQAMQNLPNKQEMRPNHNMESVDSGQNILFQESSHSVDSNSGLGAHLVTNQTVGSQNIYSRVPPLHHHSPQQAWPEEVNKKKPKSGKSVKKARQYNGIESQRINNGNQGGANNLHNSDQRNSSDYRPNQMQNLYPNLSSPSPSFMEDPSGYLAQQTALMNSTISRQVSLNMMPSNNNPIQNNINPKNNNHHSDLRDGNNFNGNQKPFIPRSGNANAANIKPDCGNSNASKNSENPGYNSSPTQSNIPDSSINIEKSMEDNGNLQQLHSHCQGCIAEMNACKEEESARNMNANDCESRFQGAGFQAKLQNFMQNISSSKSEASSQPGTPSPNQSSDENPVTSSTFIDRPGSRSNNMSADTNTRGPIQGGIISTSNGSPLETFSLPELSPTPSNSSRNTDTPQSRNSGSIQISSSCPFTIPSPAYSFQGSSRESINSNPATPSPGHSQSYVTYSSPGPLPNHGSNHLIISSHINSDGVNTYSLRNSSSNDSNESTLMQVDPQMQSVNNRIVSQNSNNAISGYYVPSHMAVSSASGNQGGQMFVHTNGIVTTMASGHTLSRNTITSVLAGKAQTATTSVNVSPALPYIYPQNPSSTTTSNQNIQFSHMNNPQNYPGPAAGSQAQTLVSKSPLEMVQSVVSSIQVAQSNCASAPIASQPATQSQAKNTINNHSMHSGHILMPSNSQFLVTGSGQGHVMAPPPPKGQQMQPLPPLSASPLVTTVTGSMSQAIPAVQQVINQPTVLVNTLPSPFMLQSQMMTVDGQVVNQNLQMPQIVTGNLISQGQMMEGQEGNRSQGIMPRPALLSPDSGKKKGKKRKAQGQTVASMLHIAAQHSPGNVLVQHNTQQQQQFPSQGFQVSPNGNISAAPMLQALTIVSGKGGTPSHIVMNGQGNGNFGSQQIIANSQGGQHINLLQPVNLLNGTTGVVQNFPTFQQFIVPGLGGMVMTSDGTAILQDASNMPMQLQIQNVNGQNVLTPIQNQGILTAGTTGMVIRTQNPNSKIIQSQHSPGAQFLSPTGGQIVMGGSPFGGQLSPLVAGVSPNHSVTFNTSPQRGRPNMQQEFIQCNPMGQTLMLPVSPSQIAVSSSSNQQNTTFVQQNTTIVQQQTTMVSNNHNNQFQNNNVGNSNNTMQSSLNDQSIIISQSGKHNNVIKGRQHNILQLQNHPVQMQQQHIAIQNSNEGQSYKRIALQYPQMLNQGNAAIKSEPHIQQMITNVNQGNLLNQQSMLHPNVRHSVSTQTLINQQQNGNKSPMAVFNHQVSGCSPPDTTTHSPLGALEGSLGGSPANSLSGRSSNSSQGNHVDTTTSSPEPNEQGSLAMVDCISSSEPDTIDNRDSNLWGRNDIITDVQGKCIVSQHIPNQQNQNSFYTVDSSGIHFNNQTITVSSVNNQQNLTITPANYYQKVNSKRNIQNSIMMMSANNQMSPEKMSNKGMVNAMGADAQNQMINSRQLDQLEKNQHHAGRNNTASGETQRNFNNMEGIATTGNGIKRISVSSANDSEDSPDVSNVSNATDTDSLPEGAIEPFKEGDLVWGPAKGYAAWPGKIVSKNRVNGKEDGKVLVRWFGGDKCLTVVDSSKLQTLSEGLEAHHAARTKCRKSRKLNGQLEKAIQEAMGELDLITEHSETHQSRIRSSKIDSSFTESGEMVTGGPLDNDSNEAGSTATKHKQSISPLAAKNTESKGRVWKSTSSKSTRNNNTGSVVKIAPHPSVSAITMSMNNEGSKGRLRSSHR